jgi:phytanoyl-CoA hydroxylase
MYSSESPDGKRIEIPDCIDRTNDKYINLSHSDAATYYNNEGYVIIRNLIDKELCRTVNSYFDSEVKTFSGYMYRQASAKLEKHIFSDEKYVQNSILNIQDINDRIFGCFKKSFLDIVTSVTIQEILKIIHPHGSTIVQSMYFEGNNGTWAHQDTYYLDADDLKSMVAVWIATENIHPGAGRFYVYPRSHLIDMQRNGGDFDIAFNHDRYKKLVIDVISKNKLICHAPALETGDVLFWNSRTIHGSLNTSVKGFSRRSITAHYIPNSAKYVNYQKYVRTLRTETMNGMKVHCPKDYRFLKSKMMYSLEKNLPFLFNYFKRLAIKHIVK